MSAELRFYSYCKLGTSANLMHESNGLNNPKLDVNVKVKDHKDVSTSLEFCSHADVLGFSESLVYRTEPKDGTHNFESNYIPFIEFSSIDFPWTLSPRAPTPAPGKLDPWLVLVVLERDSNVALDVQGEKSILTIKSKAGTLLPKLQDSFAWAHLQETIVDAAQGQKDLRLRMGEFPESFVSRLVCPIKLSDSKAYIACVVPRYMATVCKALGIKQQAQTFFDEAWTDTTNDLVLPVFYHWEFATGNEDFESLVSKLKPKDLSSIKSAELDFSNPGLGLSSLELGTDSKKARLNFLGALKISGQTESKWEGDDRSKFQARLKQVIGLEVTGQQSETLVSAPRYGSGVVGKSQPDWFLEVNLNPEYRAIAALGAEVAKARQEEIVNLAWEKYLSGDFERQVNKKARFNCLVNTRVYEKFSGLKPETIATLTDALHSKIKFDEKVSIQEKLAQDLELPSALLSSSVKRSAVKFSKQAGFKKSIIENSKQSFFLSVNKNALEGKIKVADFVKKKKLVKAGLHSFGTSSTEHSNKMTQVSDKIKISVDPKKTIAMKLVDVLPNAKVDLTQAFPIQKNVGVTFHFSIPVYQWLLEYDKNWFCPGLSEVSENSVSMFESNQKFIEAFMLGFNHEVVRELIWRNFPIDSRSTPFQVFWEYIDKTKVDILALSDWKYPFGNNNPDALVATSSALPKENPLTVFLINSQLFQKYSNHLVYLAKGIWERREEVDKKFKSKSVKKSKKNNHEKVRIADLKTAEEPILYAAFDSSTKMIGFKKSLAELRGDTSADKSGYFIVIEEADGDTHLGFDKPTKDKYGVKPESSDKLTWADIVKTKEEFDALRYIQLTSLWADDKFGSRKWGNSSSDMASLMIQKPSRVLIHCSTLVKAKED